MGALYEDVEKFFSDLFACYGRFVSRWPLPFIIISLLVSLLLTLGLLRLEHENNVQKLYTPIGSRAQLEQEQVAALFRDNTSTTFYQHQLIYDGMYAEFIITATDGGNVFRADVLLDINRLYTDVLSIQLANGHYYRDICATRNQVCIIDGEDLIDKWLEMYCVDYNSTWPTYYDKSLYLIRTTTVLGMTKPDELGCHNATAFKLRFNLKHDSLVEREESVSWERQLLVELEKFQSSQIEIAYAVTESLDIELTKNVAQDGKFFWLTVVIVIVYTTMVSCGGNWVSTRVLLAQAGVLTCLLSIFATMGLLCLCGMAWVDLCLIMPFLVLAIGIDNVFILMSGYRQSNLRDTVEERISETFRTTAITITIASLTDVLAFCIGATSTYMSVRNFCIYTGVGMFVCYVNQMTFFAGCMVLHAKRVKSNRHCITCAQTRSVRVLRADNKSKIVVLLCAGKPPRHIGDEDSVFERIPRMIIAKVLMKSPTKAIVFIIFLAYLSITMWGATRVETGLKLQNIVSPDSYFARFARKDAAYFINHGPFVQFVIYEPYDYTDERFRLRYEMIVRKVNATGYMDKRFIISWYKAYRDYLQKNHTVTSKANYVMLLRDNFLKEHPEYKNDVVFACDDDFSPPSCTIKASRFYFSSIHFNDSKTESEMMTRMREIAENSSLPIIAYSSSFIFYEHYASILTDTLLAVGVAIIGMLFIALMFIPHPVSISCVTVSMVTIVLGMLGFLHFWGIELSAVITVQVILSVGFSVEYTVPISHAFLAARGNNRNERVSSALDKVGVPILNGAVASMLGILLLAFANSYIFQTFFKAMFLVIVLGSVHSLFFLPVLLSFIGPKRTSKPRVFLPPGLMDSLFPQKSSSELGTNEAKDNDGMSSSSLATSPEMLVKADFQLQSNTCASPLLPLSTSNRPEGDSGSVTGRAKSDAAAAAVDANAALNPGETTTSLTTSWRRAKFAKGYQISEEKEQDGASVDTLSTAKSTMSPQESDSFKSFDATDSATITPSETAQFYSFDDIDDNHNTAPNFMAKSYV